MFMFYRKKGHTMKTVYTTLLIVIALCLISNRGDAQTLFTAQLEGSQEVPAVTSSATGTGWFVLNADATELTYHITFSGLTLAASHFHMAPAGTAGGVVRAITFDGNTASGVWRETDDQPLTSELVADLVAGNIYVNIHTSANPGGEIRGQVNVTRQGSGFTAQLEGSQEVPAVTSSATGTGWFILNPEETELTYHVTFSGLTLAASHFHMAPAGTAGGVVRAITFDGNTASGVWKSTDTQALTPELAADLLAGNIYVNIHTSANPGGEIRGQVNLVSRGGPPVITAVESQTWARIKAVFVK
jgi:hypothetical protein